MRIKVEKRHIYDGDPCVTDRCPVALAARSAGLKLENVSRSFIFFKKEGTTHSVRMPDDVRSFIRNFDQTKPSMEVRRTMKPFEFDVDLEGAEPFRMSE